MMKYRNLWMTAIAVALVAANAVSYAAQEGARWTHLGEVTSINGNRLVMTQSQGQEKSFTLTTGAKVTLDGRTIVAAELKPGTKIRVTTTKEDQNAVRRIEAIDKRSDFADSFRDGKLVSITGNQLVMASMRGRKHSHTLAADAELILDGKVIEATDLKPGMKIRATTEGADQDVVNRIEAIDKNSDFASSTREGGLFGGTDNQLAQPRTNERMETERSNQNAKDRSDATDQRSDAARTQQYGAQAGNTANAAKNRLDGQVVSVTDNRLVMKDHQGQEHSPTLTADAKCTLDGKACKAADLKPGTRVCVTTCGANQSEANRVEGIDKNPDFASSSGEGGQSRGTDNQVVQPGTSVRMATEGTSQNAADRSDAIDQRSDAARTQQDGAQAGKAANVAKNRLDGKVVSLTDNRLVMTDLQGQEHSRTLKANAKLTLDGKACEAADLKPGTRIRVTTGGADRSVANRIEGIDKNPDFASSRREGGQSRGTDNQVVQPRTNGRMATEGTNQNATDRSDAIDQRSDAAKTQQEGKLVSITGNRLVMTGARGNAERTSTLATDVRVTCDGRPCKAEDLRQGMRIRVTTESKAPHKTIRIEALDKNVEFASL